MWLWLGVFAFFVLVYFSACYGVFCYAFRRANRQGREAYEPNRPSKHTPADPYAAEIHAAVKSALARSYEKASIISRDGLTLCAKIYTPQTRRPRATIILFHGYRSFPERDFGCALPYYLEECGLRILMVDQRAHGESEGKYITFGIREREDCVDWAAYAAERFGENEPILLDGMSMGASTVMMAAGEDLPKNIVGIIADCGYTSVMAILQKVGRDMHMPVLLLLPGVFLLCRLHGFDPLSVDAPRALARNTRPLLMVHGMADGFVPYEMSVENYNAAAGDKRMISVEGADHGMSFLVDRPVVIDALKTFFDKILPKESPL